MVRYSCEALEPNRGNNLVHDTVKKIKSIFRKIGYGLRDPKTNKPWRDTHKSTTKDDYINHWRLGTPEQTVSVGVGNCYDTVAISREYLAKDKKFQYRVFFISVKDAPRENHTHTFLIYKCSNDKWKWLEGSWNPFKNNDWDSDTYKGLVKRIATAMANTENEEIEVRELDGYPKYGCTMEEYEDFCLKRSVVMTVKKG